VGFLETGGPESEKRTLSWINPQKKEEGYSVVAQRTLRAESGKEEFFLRGGVEEEVLVLVPSEEKRVQKERKIKEKGKLWGKEEGVREYSGNRRRVRGQRATPGKHEKRFGEEPERGLPRVIKRESGEFEGQGLREEGAKALVHRREVAGRQVRLIFWQNRAREIRVWEKRT